MTIMNTLVLPALMLCLLLPCSAARAAEVSEPKLPMEIPVLVIKFFPAKGDRIDRAVTGDWGETLDETRTKTTGLTEDVIRSLQEGSRYHGYKDPAAKPSLAYRVVQTIEFLEPIPVIPQPGRKTPYTDYNKIMERVNIRRWVEEQGVKEVWIWGYHGGVLVNIRRWVEEQGVKEVWIWGYHGGVLVLWESNMAGPFGDISNSNRDAKDLPVLKKTYTVYHYNYQRGASEAVEDHIHQIEAVLNHVDGRDRIPPEKWGELLFWGRFVGSDRSHKIIRPGCGWAHYPPNGERDYDWGNKRFVETDIEAWKPDGSRKKQQMNCERWGGSSLKWFVYWMQNLPGANNGLNYERRPLNNWWIFIGDFDEAMSRGMKLAGSITPARSQ